MRRINWSELMIVAAVGALFLSTLPGMLIRMSFPKWGWQAETPLITFCAVTVLGMGAVWSPLMNIDGEFGARKLRARLRGRNARRFGTLLLGCACVLGALFALMYSHRTTQNSGVRVLLSLLASITAATSLVAFMLAIRCRQELRLAAREEANGGQRSCRTCGYSREGLDPGLACPECGTTPIRL